MNEQEYKVKGWVARNGNQHPPFGKYVYDNQIVFSYCKPKLDEYSQWHLAHMYLDSKLFPNLQCEDEPIEVELTIKKI